MGGLSLLGDFAARNLADTRLIELLKKVLAAVFFGRFRGLHDWMNQSTAHRENATVEITLTTSDPSEVDTLTAVVKCAHFTTAPVGERTFLCSPRRYSRDYYLSRGFTDYWTVAPAQGISADDSDTFAVLDYKLNGHPYPITRTIKRGEQLYRATPSKTRSGSDDGMHHEEYTYRIRVPRDGGSLHFTVDIPTRGYALKISHFNTGISRLSLLDFFASDTEPRINSSDPELPAPVDVSIDGWIMPTSGVAVTWTLNPPIT